MGNTVRFLIKVFLIYGLWVCTGYRIYAQTDTTRRYAEVSLLAGYTSNEVVPFWIRSNQYGSIPLEGASGGVLVRAAKNYAYRREWTDRSGKSIANWDWGYGLEARTNVGSTTKVQLIDAHVKARYAMFEAKLGRTKDVMGLNGDTLLSSGNFAVSGNALGVPMLDIRIPEYYRLPWWDGLFSVKGNFANGYMGRVLIDGRQLAIGESDKFPTFLHQKSLYGRLGRSDWRINLYGGINHQVQFGSERKIHGDIYTLNNFETLWHVFWGIPYGVPGIPKSKLGNHGGSVDLGFSYDWDDIQLMVYRQNFYDIGAISKLANIADGLNGVTLTNKQYSGSTKTWDWQKVLFEFFYSKNQAGYPWSKSTKSGDENYYNNYFYSEGWSYKSRGLGSPLIIPKHDVKEGQVSDPTRYFISNRVVAAHFGAKGRVQDWTVNSKLTYARHFGTFATSEYGSSLGDVHTPPQYGIFTPVSQFSAYLQGERELRNDFFLGVRVALDQGQLLDNSIGGQVSLRKLFRKR